MRYSKRSHDFRIRDEFDLKDGSGRLFPIYYIQPFFFFGKTAICNYLVKQE